MRLLKDPFVLLVGVLLLIMAARYNPAQLTPAQLLAVVTDPSGFSPLPGWLSALTARSAYAITVLLGVLGLYMMLHGWRAHRVAVLYAIFIAIFGLRDIELSDPTSSIVAVFVGALFFAIGRVPDDAAECAAFERRLITGFMLYGILMTVANVLLIAHGVGFLQHRFEGLAFHPNALGQMVAITGVAMLALAVDEDRPRATRLWCFAISIADLYLLLSSGSRGALVVYLFGMALFAYQMQLSPRLIVAAVCVAAGLDWVRSLLDSSNPDILLRLVSTTNDRTGAFLRMWNAFLDSPVVGSGVDVGASENAFLKALAATGVVGGSVFVAFVYTALRHALVGLRERVRRGSGFRLAFFGRIIAGIALSMIVDGYTVERASLSGALVLLSVSGIIAELRASGRMESLRAR